MQNGDNFVQGGWVKYPRFRHASDWERDIDILISFLKDNPNTNKAMNVNKQQCIWINFTVALLSAI